MCKEDCCAIHKMTASICLHQILVPLKSVMIKSELRGCLSTTVFELSYVNPMSENPLECSYTFPVDPYSVMCDFEATIGDRKMVTKIQEKAAALEKYDDAIASGNAAVLATRSSLDKETLIKLGNLNPQQEATIKMTIISIMECVNGQYQFHLPDAFHPDYFKHSLGDLNWNYSFGYEIKILSKTPISNMIIPEFSVIAN